MAQQDASRGLGDFLPDLMVSLAQACVAAAVAVMALLLRASAPVVFLKL